MASLVGAGKVFIARGWYVLNNVWNPGPLVQGTDYTITSTYDPANLTSGTTFNWSFPDTPATTYGGVRAYPEVFFGPAPKATGENPSDPAHVFPVQVRDIAGLISNYDVSYSGSVQGFNVSYNLFLTSVPNGKAASITNELMIWLHQGDVAAYGTPVGYYSSPTFSGTIYHSAQDHYTALISSTDMTKGQVDIAAIIQRLQDIGIISPDEYLADIHLGAEVVTGKGSFSINDFSFDLTTRGLDNAASYSRVTGSGTTKTAAPPEWQLSFSTPPSSVLRAPDFNGDGKNDILLQNVNGQGAIWFMNGQNLLPGSGSVHVNPGVAWKLVGAGDFNADGKSDVLLQNINGQAAIWFMDGPSVLAGSGNAWINPGVAWSIRATRDFNNDGKADVVLQNANGEVAFWLMNGTSVLAGSGSAPVNPGSDWRVAGVGDFNGDGKSDVLLQNTDGQVAIWLMDGLSVLAGSGNAGVNPGVDWKVAGTGDFNDDGKSDVLLQNDNGQAAIWFMNGTTVAAASGNAGVNLGSNWKIVGTGDFNQDRVSDILWRNNNGQIDIWSMSGTKPLFSSQVGNPSSYWNVATS